MIRCGHYYDFIMTRIITNLDSSKRILVPIYFQSVIKYKNLVGIYRQSDRYM